MSDWKARAVPAQEHAPPAGGDWKARAISATDQYAEPLDTRSIGRRAIDAVESYTGTPSRAFVGAIQDRKGIKGAVGAAYEAAGQDVSAAPSPADIVSRAGITNDERIRLPGTVGMAINAAGLNTPKRLAEVLVAGGVDWTNLIPMMGAAKQTLVTPKAAENVAAIGRGLQGAAEAGGSALGRAAAKLGSNLTAMPAQDIETYATRRPQVKSLIDAAPGNDFSALTDDVRQGGQDALRKTKSELSEIVDQSNRSGSRAKTLSIDPVVSKLEQAKAKLDPRARPEAVAQINEIIERVKRGAIADQDVERIMGVPAGATDMQWMHETKNMLQDRARPAYQKNGEIFQSAPEAAKASKSAAAEARMLYNQANPEGAKANNRLSRIHRLDEALNKNLIAPGKSDAALFAAGSGLNKRNERLIRLVEGETGYPMLQKARDLSAAREFGNATLLPKDATGKAVARMMLSGAGGYLLGDE